MSSPGLTLELHLDSREPDRVRVTVNLLPVADPVTVTGVAIEFLGRHRESLGPKMILPISGTVKTPTATSTELRAHGSLPRGSVVEATVWTADEEFSVTCTADPPPRFEGYVRGHHAVPSNPRGRSMNSLSSAERLALSASFPWLPTPEEVTDSTDGLPPNLDLDEDDAAWLHQLMEE